MKKIIMFLSLCMVLMLGLVSCGCQDNAAANTTPPSSTPSTGADYNANDKGTVDGDSNVSNGNNGMTGADGTIGENGNVNNGITPNGTGNDHSTTGQNGANVGNGTTDHNGTDHNGNTDQGTDANGDGVLGDVGRAVGDMARGTERAVRDIF